MSTNSGNYSVIRILFLALLGCALTASAAEINTPASTGNALPENNIFVQKNCALCHSVNGSDARGAGPALSKMQLSNSLLDFAGDMWNHGPTMVKKAEQMKVGIPHLESQDIAALISFMTAYRYYTKGAADKGDGAKGEIVWRGMKCSACHTLADTSGKLGSDLRSYKDLSAVQMVQSMWNHGPDMIAAMTANGISAPRFSGKDMQDLLAYIRASTGMKQEEVFTQLGDPSRGAQVFREKNCIACHPVSEGSTTYGPKMERREEFMEGTSGVAALMWNHSVTMWSEMKKASMPSPKFKNQEMSDLLAYLYLSTYSETPGDPVMGKRLFELKKCLSCHKPGSETKTAAAGSHSALVIVAGLWNHLPAMSQQYQEDASRFPRINPGEMKDLVAYLESTQK